MPSERDQSKKRKSVEHSNDEAVDRSEARRIREMIALLIENDLEELELESHGCRIKVRKGTGAHSAPMLQPQSHSLVQSAAPLSRTPVSPAEPPPAVAGETPVSAADDAGLHVVRSPMVGTFYRAANPTARPFVEVGDRVQIGSVLCIIEAMKLMNNIDAEVAGEVVSIYAENAQPVEYNQPLFAIRTS